MSIVQGDQGYVVPFTVKHPNIENLEGATVEVTVKRGEEVINKQATIIDTSTRECSFSLSSTDLTIVGIYQYQWTTTLEDGRVLSSKKRDFYVSEKLVGVPPGDGSGPITVTVDGGVF